MALAFAVVFAATVGGGALLTYNHAMDARHEAEVQRDAALEAKAETEAKLEREKAHGEAREIVFDAERERLAAAHERSVENATRAARAAGKADADAIAKTAQRAPEKYTKFVARAAEHNLKAIECRSNLGTVRDPSACPLTVR